MLTSQDQVVLTSLEIVISLLVFGVGLPASLSDRGQWLRRTRDRHSIGKWYPTIVGFILMVIAIILTLYFIETTRFLGCSVQSSLQLNSLCQFTRWSRSHAHTISGLLVIIALVITLSLWVRLRSYTASYVVIEIGNIALGRSSRQRLFHFVDVGMVEKESCIRDLGDIGELVEFDDERLLVLATLQKLTEGNQLFDANDPSYLLLRTFMEALLKATTTEDVDSQKKGLEIMKDILPIAFQRGGYRPRIVSQYLVRLGRQTLSLESDELDTELLEIVQTDKSEHTAISLFEWSIFALELGRDRAAMSFADKLQAQTDSLLLIDDSGTLQYTRSPDILCLFIGLVAHFCTVNGGAGGTQQREGWRLFDKTFQRFEHHMDPLFDRGIQYFRLVRADFVTVDRVVELRESFNDRITR